MTDTGGKTEEIYNLKSLKTTLTDTFALKLKEKYNEAGVDEIK